jgi:hypothetical protein
MRCNNYLTNYTSLEYSLKRRSCMSVANIKIPTDKIKELKRQTGEETGQKAVQKAILYFLKEARQRRITEILENASFQPGFDPLKLRHNER